MSMRNLTLTVTLVAIVTFSFAIYFLVSHFSPQTPVIEKTSPTPISPTQTLTPPQATTCKPEQLSGTLSAQGAAGNIYAKLTLTNIGKTACDVELGNTITAIFEAKNIVLHPMQTVSPETLSLMPGDKAYSQVHYPNGPQCQSGITPVSITVQYSTNQTSAFFKPDAQTGKVLVQACSAQTEKTTIDIWPLSKNPITP